MPLFLLPAHGMLGASCPVPRLAHTWLWAPEASDKGLSFSWVSCSMSGGTERALAGYSMYPLCLSSRVYRPLCSSSPGSMSLQVGPFPFSTNGLWVLQMSLSTSSLSEGGHFLLPAWSAFQDCRDSRSLATWNIPVKKTSLRSNRTIK